LIVVFPQGFVKVALDCLDGRFLSEILNAHFKSVYTQEDYTNITHKGPLPYSAMQNITITGNGVYKLLRNSLTTGLRRIF
jgi:hypothetical protein